MPKELWVTSQGDNVIFIRNFEDLSDRSDRPAGRRVRLTTSHT